MHQTRVPAGGDGPLPSEYNDGNIGRLQPCRTFKEEFGVILRLIVPLLRAVAEALESPQASSSGNRPASNLFDKMIKCREAGNSWQDAMDSKVEDT